MPERSGQFSSVGGKRRILIAEDEAVSREMLCSFLGDEYELLCASDGREALGLAREHRESLSLILLDLIMPEMDGREVLRYLKEDQETAGIPVIVMTADRDAEVTCLILGAVDFISKPYPSAEVILARVRRIVELFESRQTIRSTEKDPLTGLYTREYFNRYAEQYDRLYRDVSMDAVILDINRFWMINERCGREVGDRVLRAVGEKIRETARSIGGIACRRGADTFMIYCPHGSDCRALLNAAASGLEGIEGLQGRARLRMGVYADADRTIGISRRFNRAALAAETVRNSPDGTVGMYDQSLYERELFEEQLIEDFPRAVEERQFRVFYQPKFDIRPDIPVLAGAEALVRWQHPKLGLIEPGVFVPLFEDNGLIQRLDRYVWQEAAAQIHVWKDRGNISVPVSVNMSRVDMYDPGLTQTLTRILGDNGLPPEDFRLEITESAYTRDEEQMITAVKGLRERGFRIEMDDFGTGYSSLSMITTLPIDGLKLDMAFIRNAFSPHRDTHMLELVMGIAGSLHVPVIAEGVETEEQLQVLRQMGCDLIQGYYFSRPVPAEEYETLAAEKGSTGRGA